MSSSTPHLLHTFAQAGVFVAAAFDQTVRVGMVGGVAML